jgi:hypothetical protein
MSDTKVYFLGRPDGIGNRIEQLINIQEYCIENNLQCNYIWNNNNFRNYLPLITFDNIVIVNKQNNDNNTKNANNIFKRSKDFQIRYKFNFDINLHIEYDTIIHIRAGDRLNSNIKHSDYSNINELNIFIEKMINYVNNNTEINTYTVISDDNRYIDKIKNRINKQFITLSYDYNIPNEWLDYYYLTKSKQKIIMCCKFSSYSITASILANKPLFCFKQSLNSNLLRYKANIKFID